MLSGRKKRIGDFVAGTMVVYREKHPTVSETEVLSTQSGDIALNTEQQAAVVAFYERSKQLSPQRQQELANLLSPVINQDGQEAVEKLKSIAVNLVGKS